MESQKTSLMHGSAKFCLLGIVIVLMLQSSCTTQNITKSIYKPDDIVKNDKFNVIKYQLDDEYLETVKLHMKDGRAYIFEAWKRNDNADSIIGMGQMVDINRNTLTKGKYSIPVKDISLIETDKVSPSLNFIGLVGSYAVTLGFTIYCATHPKECFGSCPTFYAWDGEKMKLMSEGFSASILPSLEENDIDALWFAKPKSNILEIDLTNEAIETHFIRKANIIAVKRDPGTRIIQDGNGNFAEFNNFIHASEIDDPADNHDSTAFLLSEFDGKDRFSYADSNDLAKKEYVYFRFNNLPSDNSALIIASRQSLVTTFLFYQTLAYMGTKAGDILASIDEKNSEFHRQIEKSDKLIGGIDAEILTDGGWQVLGSINEKGPIASDIKYILLPKNTKSPLNIRLKLSKGYIRLDYVSLASYCRKTKPLTIKPSMVYSGGREKQDILNSLTNMDKPLVTFPGDKYRIVYSLPDDYADYELFMDTKGYYLEWIRDEWKKEENPGMVFMYFSNPDLYYKILAPMFKKVEPVIEQNFWSSRYVK